MGKGIALEKNILNLFTQSCFSVSGALSTLFGRDGTGWNIRHVQPGADAKREKWWTSYIGACSNSEA